jgi:RNA polymerase sigma factor (sigma-70 family)
VNTAISHQPSGFSNSLEKEEILRELDVEIERLPERHRKAVILHYLTGAPQRDVGAALGTSEEGARKLIARGLDWPGRFQPERSQPSKQEPLPPRRSRRKER